MKTVILFYTCLFWAFLSVFSLSLSGGELKIEEGEIEGALFKIVRPENATGDLLLLAHGFRPPETALSADFDFEDNLFSALLNEGWTIASTSYRKNGWIIEYAINDLINLRRHISEGYGHPTRTFILGGSMGGIIITLMAEQYPEVINGGLAMGAALADEEGKWRVRFNFQPMTPVLYLTNQSEIAGPENYVQLAAEAFVPPVLWSVSRDGHVNLNDAEQTAAFRALVAWSKSGEIKAGHDGTIVPAVESTATITDTFAEGSIRNIHPIYGNIISSFVPSDLETVGIKKGDEFDLSFGEQHFPVLMGSNFSDVEIGNWVAFWNADGYLFISRNFKNAAATLGAGEGETLRISKLSSLPESKEETVTQ